MQITKLFDGTIALDPTYHGWPTLTNVGGDKLAVVCSGGREAHICPFGKVFL